MRDFCRVKWQGGTVAITICSRYFTQSADPFDTVSRGEPGEVGWLASSVVPGTCGVATA